MRRDSAPGAVSPEAVDARACADWPLALRAYLVAIGIGNLVWEAAHLPLYTIWDTGSAREKAFAVLHCTAGDILIALTSLALGLVSVGNPVWPLRGFWRVLLITVVVGIGYTIFSEWLNIVVRASWSYSERMPVVPIIGTGVSPLFQWLVVPTLASLTGRLVASRSRRRGSAPLAEPAPGQILHD